MRRCNERLRKMVQEEQRPYQQLAVARFLGGVLYEDQGEIDDAFIDYREALRLEPSLSRALAEPLLRLARAGGRAQELEELQRQLGAAPPGPPAPDTGQLVILIEAGLAPQKEEERHVAWAGGKAMQMTAVPVFRSRGLPGRAAVEVGAQSAEAALITSVHEVARRHLEDRVGRVIARLVASTAIRAGIAAGVGAAAKDENAGFLAFFLLSLFEAADLRSWLSLPAEFQAARFRLPAGAHTVTVRLGGHRSEHQVLVRARRVGLLVVRAY